MLPLAAFTDEISPDLDVQIRVCKENAVTHVELRGVNDKNVLDFDKPLCREIKSKVDASGLKILTIGSPIGKVKITDDWNTHWDRFKYAVELAEFFGTKFIRIFSYYPDDKGEIKKYREEVIRRMQQKLEYIKDLPITILHENEAKIYGELGPECLDLMKSVNSPRFRMAFDFANFVQAKQKPLDCWPDLKPYTSHIHIKDARWSDGHVLPAGQGDGQMEPILKDAWASGYRGFLSLEPHLKVHGQFGGYSGPEAFKVAADAIKSLCRKLGIPLAGAT